MNKLRLFLILLAVAITLPIAAQSRKFTLQFEVTSATGESLEGQRINLEQTDYSITYAASETTLNAEGKLTVKVYAGNHRITVERTGYATVTEDINVTSDMTVSLTLTEAVRNPFALKTIEHHDPMTGLNTVGFSWNREDPAFFDDFEGYDAFSVDFAPWTGIDADHEAAAALTGSYTNRGALQYAQIINPLTVEPSWWAEYPVLRPYSGKQYVGFIRTNSGNANDDWLISPAITVGKSNIVRFMAKAADVYKERFEVGITTSDNPSASDFTIISSGNYETVEYAEWEAKQYDLSAYEGETVRIAIHYIGDVNNGGAFMLMVDDFFVGQADYFSDETEMSLLRSAQRSPANPNEYFYVYLDGTKVGETSGYSYTLTDVAAGTHKLGVKALYQNAESDIVEQNFTIGEGTFYPVSVTTTVNDGADVKGFTLDLFNTTTSESYSVAIDAATTEIKSLPAGSYLAEVSADRYKKWSQELTVNSASAITINLIEDIIDPYNITVTNTDNAADASKIDTEVHWNQDLGFSDSFEDYDDFATSFGEWTSIDNDLQVVYPIGLGSTSNIVNFPGASTVDSPAAVAPMVFNPYKTTPAMAPSDAAVIAPTGDKTVIFFSPQQYTADKWLISPAQEIRAGYIWQFSAKAYASYPETFEVCISTTDASTGSFTAVDKISPSSSSWQVYTVDLSAYAGQTIYVALHYVSTDAFFAQADDFYVGPEEATDANVGNVKEYRISLDGTSLGTTTATVYTLSAISRGEHTVGIQAVYASGESAVTYYTFNAESAVEALETTGIKVAAGEGFVRITGAAGQRAAVYNAAGQQVASQALSADTRISLAPGFYAVKVGKTVAKVIVR